MTQRERRIGLLLSLLWAGMPLYPAFISLVPIAPPGVSLIPAHAALAVLALVGLASALLFIDLYAELGARIFEENLVRGALVFIAAILLASVCGFVPIVGVIFCAIALCTVIGLVGIRAFGARGGIARMMTYALLLSSLCASTFALALWLLRRPAILYAIGNGRAIGTFVVPGELAGYLGMLVPFALGTALTTREWRLRCVAWLACVVGSAAALASFSRAGIFGLVVAVLFLAYVRGHRRAAMGAAVAIALLALAARQFFDLHHNPAEDFNRPSIWFAALREIKLFPLTGVGPGGFARVYPLVRLPGGEAAAFHAHNFLLTMGAETGLVGLAALVALWSRFIMAFRARFATASAPARLAALAVAAGFVATWTQSMLDVVQILFLGLWIPFMGMALNALEGDFA